MDEEELNRLSGWDNPQSDPITDLKKFFSNVLYERWICKQCAWWTNYPQTYGTAIAALQCPECEGTDFHHTAEPYELHPNKNEGPPQE